ncbi:alpha/beta hydrolase [Pseudonocardia nematodicida]|uniref:Alpha/beta hydrolase n=1 Tax=Pseudonocardia nematodicida TaxID=1206997 RepID=A0ABV1KHM6_9PSEU
MTDVLDRPHVWLPGSPGHPPLLLLHGTGGDEHDLLPLRAHLDPEAPVLSVRGTVLENGMPRFFRRQAEGVFDEDDLRVQVDALAGFLVAAEHRYAVAPGSWTAVGFSNGANIASALLFTHPERLAGAVLLAAMVPFRDGPPQSDLTGRHVLVSNGRRDPMATADHTSTLVGQFRAAGAETTTAPHDGGHTIAPDLLPTVADWLAGTPLPSPTTTREENS